MSTEKSAVNIPDEVKISSLDLLEIVLLCQAALAQDSPEPPKYYINQILGYAMGPLPRYYRPRVERYLAEKEYLPPLKLVKPNEAESNKAANIILNENSSN